MRQVTIWEVNAFQKKYIWGASIFQFSSFTTSILLMLPPISTHLFFCPSCLSLFLSSSSLQSSVYFPPSIYFCFPACLSRVCLPPLFINPLTLSNFPMPSFLLHISANLLSSLSSITNPYSFLPSTLSHLLLLSPSQSCFVATHMNHWFETNYYCVNTFVWAAH